MPRGKQGKQDALDPSLEGDTYEGHPIEEKLLSIVSASALGLEDEQLRLGNVVELLITGVVTKVSHQVKTEGDRDGGRQHVRKTFTIKADGLPKIEVTAERAVIVGSEPSGEGEDDPQ